MKKRNRIFGVVMASCMLVSATSALAAAAEKENNNNYLQESIICYSDGEGRTLTNIDGEVYQVIDINDAKATVVTDPELLKQLNAGNSRAVYSSSPSYDYDLTLRSYFSKRELSRWNMAISNI